MLPLSLTVDWRSKILTVPTLLCSTLLQQLGRKAAHSLLPADVNIPPVLVGELGKGKVVGKGKQVDGEIA